MSYIPYGVISCLYSGISDKLDFIKKQLDSPLFNEKSYLNGIYKNVKEAVEFYSENCVISASLLNEKLNEIRPYFENKMDPPND